MDKTSRYIVWRTNTKAAANASVRALLSALPAVQMLQCEDLDYAVVLMDVSTEQKIRQLFPELCVEKDLQYQMTS
jgi:hypothetical protein